MPIFAVAALAGVTAVAVTAATAGLAAVTLSTFAVPAVVSLGVGLITRALAPKPPSPALLPGPTFDQPSYASPMQTATQRISAVASVREVGVRGTAAQSINSAIAPARWIVGTVRTVGRTVWVMVFDDDVQMPDTTIPGEWGGTVLYARGDKAVRNTVIYRSLLDNNLGNDPDGEAATVDEWAENTKYGENVQVLFEGKVYASKGGENADEPPPNEMFWTFVANIEDLSTAWAKIESVEEATKPDTVSSLYIAQVISEGACEGIEEIWLDGEKLSVTKSTKNNHSVYTAPGFECHEYFKADGTEGGECFKAAAAGSPDLEWSAATVYAEGLSWVYIKLTQNDYGRDYDSRRYNGVPTIEFVIKGIKISAGRDPDGTKSYTENAAIVRKWWLTERRGIDFNRINKTYYRAAVSRCDTTIDISNLNGFDSSAMQTDLVRYTINTLIHSGDDVTRVEQDMDFAWDGSIVEWDGELLFRPGGDRASVKSIVGEDIVEEPRYRPGTTLNTNRYLCNLPQSEWHDYLPYNILVDDTGRQEYDGSVQTLNLGTASMVTNPAQAANLLRSVARRARASSSIELVIMPGDNFENAAILPGDKVTVNIPEIAINDQDFIVLSTRVLAGWAVSLNLTEWGSDWFDDSVSLEHYSPRQVIPISGGAIAAPVNASALITAVQNDDGTFVWYALVSVDRSIWNMNVRYKPILDEVYQESTTANNSLVLILNQSGKWEFEIRLTSRDNRRSPAVTLEADATFDVSLPPDPVLARKTIESGFFRYVFTNLGPFVNGVEIAYTFAEIGEPAPGTIGDDAAFVAAEQLGQYPIVPAPSLIDERTVIDSIPTVGQFNLYARVRDIAGRYSGIIRLGLETLRLDAPTNVDVDELGDGTRSYTWTLAPSAHIAGVQIRYKRAGDFIPTPGAIENAPPTIIAANVTEDGDVVLAYSEPLDVDSVPAKGRFTVSVAGSNKTPASVTVESNTVTLVMTAKITVGQAVTVSYRVPNNNKLQDTHGDAAVALSDHVVNNVLRDNDNQPAWLSMEPLQEGYLTSSPYLAKTPGAGIWDIAFRTIGVNGRLSVAITYLQVSLNEPVQLDIATAVQKAIADNPSLITLTTEVEAAQKARDRAIAAAVEGEAFRDSAQTFANAAETSKEAAEQAEAAVASAKSAVEQAEQDAEASATKAESEAGKSEASAGKAATSEQNAAGSVTTAAAHVRSASAEATKAANSASASATSASTAATKASEAGSSADAADTAKTAAETARGRAETAETNASSSASDAADSATAAASSLSSVKASADAAKTAKDEAETAKDGAESAKDDAETAEGNASSSATAAAESAKTAKAQADAASTSASAASSDRVKAETARSGAETAETNAASSASDADGSATAAAGSESAVAANAKTAKDNADAAVAASQTATAKASEASTSAAAAETAKTAAETAQSNAGTSEMNAATSATNADGSATASAASATAAAASAQTATDQATASAASATTAAAKATEAGTFASAAEVSKVAAETSEANAKVSETNAAAAQTTADGFAASAKLSSEAAAGFSTTAQQAVAGLTATVSAEIDKNLKVTFASIIAMRAVAGDTQAKLELVALSDPSGSRAAGVMTGDFQSFDFQTSVVQQAKAATLNIQGFTVRHLVPGKDGNNHKITFATVRGLFNPSINIQFLNNETVILIRSRVGSFNISRADIVSEVQKSAAQVTLSGTGSLSINVDGSDSDAVQSNIESRNLTGGADLDPGSGKGWRFGRDGKSEVDASNVRGTISADNVDSNVSNWKLLVKARNNGVGMRMSAGGAGGGSTTVLENRIIRIPLDKDIVKVLAYFYDRSQLSGSADKKNLDINFVYTDNIPIIRNAGANTGVVSNFYYGFNFIESASTFHGSNSAWVNYAIFDPDTSSVSGYRVVAGYLNATKELILALNYRDTTRDGGRQTYLDVPNLFAVQTPNR